MQRLLMLLSCGLLLLALPIWLCAADAKEGKKAKLPPFDITALRLHADINKNIIVYEGNVHFTSPVNSTNLTCRKLEANSASANTITDIYATGDVVFTMITVPTKKDSPAYHIRGEGQTVHYGMVAAEPVVRMETAKNTAGKEVQPVLVITNQSTGEKSTMTGDHITYNLTTGQLDVDNPHNQGGSDN